jgi:hypothetical protein
VLVIKDFEKEKEKLIHELSLYRDYVVTFDNKITAKKDLALLRKIRKAVEDTRISNKKEFDKAW